MGTYDVRKILVPLDDTSSSKRGLTKAITFARQCHATIIGMNIIPIPIHGGFYGYKLYPSYKKSIQEMMDNVKVTCAKRGVDFKSKITYGESGEEIIEYAHNPKNHISLIVIGTRGHGVAREMFFGSTSNYIIHKSKIPVLVVR